MYNFADLQLLSQLDTCANPTGLCALSAGAAMVLAVPGAKPGHVHVELYSTKSVTKIEAHESALACIALSADGSLLATASEKGTLVRVWSTATGAQLKELRRGVNRAGIHSLAFAPSNSMLCVASGKVGSGFVFLEARKKSCYVSV